MKHLPRIHKGKRLSQVSDAVSWLIMTCCILYILYTGVKVSTLASFRVPTASMYPAIYPGDYIMVNKWIMGARIYNVFSDYKKEKVHIYRLPGISGIKRNDVIVFNYPYADKSDSIHLDFNEYFVKRCIAIPGDTLEIRQGFYKIRGVSQTLGNLKGQTRLSAQKNESFYDLWKAFPKESSLGWTIKEFGPLHIPAKGQTISMDSTNWKIYHKLIEWELSVKTVQRGNQVFLSDSLIHSYQFQENYYFAGGDNMQNSDDSRYWGLLPESFIVGKATRIWKSIDTYDGSFRWKRFWREIE